MAVEYMNDDEFKVFVVRALKDLVRIAMEEKQEVKYVHSTLLNTIDTDIRNCKFRLEQIDTRFWKIVKDDGVLSEIKSFVLSLAEVLFLGNRNAESK